MNILATGSKGQLGTHIRNLTAGSNHVWHFTDVAELDITSADAVNRYVDEHSIGLVINCAAYTNVDAAEADEATAHNINATAVAHLSGAMRRTGGFLIHISTDYVFGGTRHNTPCTEDEPTNPTGAYGRTKLSGEAAATQCRNITIRTAWLYSEYGKNFLLTMMRLTAEKPSLNVVFDQVGTPTYAGDLAQAIFTIVENNSYAEHEGLYHYSNEGVCSWYDFAVAIAQISGHTQCHIAPCHSSEFPSPVVRPAYSVLDKSKIKQTFGIEIPHWEASLRRCIANIIQ